MTTTINASTSSGLVNTADTSGILQLQTANTTALTIDASQNVGIGTTTLTNKLNVAGAINSSGALSAIAANTVALSQESGFARLAAFGPNSSTAGTLYLYTINSAGGGQNGMVIDSSGNVGIGTTTPGYPLQVYTSSSSNANTISMVNNATSNTSALAFVQNGSTTASYSYITGDGRSSGYLSFATNNAERVRIDSSGNFGIGTQPSYKLDVVSGANRVAQFVNGTNTSGYSSIFSSIQSNGNNTSTYHFQGNTSGVGNWYLWGNGTTTFSSDQRLKKNIESTRDGYLEDLAKLRVVKYNWKNDADGTPKELGLIAQDVEEVFAGLVQDDIGQISDEDTTIYKQLKVSVLPFMLLKAIQELKAINDTQAETINALTARVVALESKVGV